VCRSDRTPSPFKYSLLIGLLMLGVGTLFTRGDSLILPPPQSAKASPSAALTTTPVPQGLTARDWASLKEAYEQQRHAVVARTTESGTNWQARNHEQQWLTHFDGRGVEVKPEGTNWQWGLELQSYGWAGNERTVSSTAPVTTAQERLTYDWDETLQEWYLNDQRGLEHGFTVRQRPAGAGEQLTFQLGVRGGLRPQAQPDGGGISFVTAKGGTVLTYAGLKAFDANGQTLPARLEADKDTVRLTVETEGAQYPITIDPIAQQAYIKASNPGAGDDFGHGVAISGDTVVVTARFEDSNATGINGDQSNNSAKDAGAAYVFVRSGGGWIQQAYLKASNTEEGDQFGSSVAISGDTIIIGAIGEDSAAAGLNGDQADNSKPDAGAAYVFVRNAGTWSQQAYIKASNPDIADLFGWSAGLSGDTAVVGAWLEASAATGINGNQNDNSAGVAGAAYVFVRTAGNWSQQAYLKASNTNAADSFGYALGISGNTIVVGAPFESSNARTINGNQHDNSASVSGAAYVFVRNGSTWTQQSYLKASNADAADVFGWSVAIAGETVLVGAPYEASDSGGVNSNQNDNTAALAGAAYVFQRSGNTWSQQAYLKAATPDPTDFFGWSVALFGDKAVVGAQGEASDASGVNGNQQNNTSLFSGAAYVFTRFAGNWTQLAFLKASNPDPNDVFGWGVAIDGDTVIVAAKLEASNTGGINGNQSDNSAGGAGAVYVFVIPPPDLSIVKTDNGAIFMPGGTGDYAITVSNALAAGPTVGPITVTDNLPANLSLTGFSGAGWNCTGTTNVSCTHNGPLAAGASLPTLTLTVKVGANTPTGINSISNTATIATAEEVITNNNSSSDSTSVLALPKLAATLADPLVCNGPGGLVSGTTTLTNPNQTPLPASFTAMLPPQLTAVPGTCNVSVNPGACTIAPDGSAVTWNGTLNPEQTVTISYQATVADSIVSGAQLCVNSVGTVASVVANVQACFTVCSAGVQSPLANVGVSNQKSGSLLVFPYYNSKSAERKDTRLTLSNAGTKLAYVHLFFIDGVSCNQADLFVCLTPRAIYSFKASDYDPENTGYALAVVVDNQGRPIAQNGLIGNAFVDEGDVHGNYGAEAFWRHDTALTGINGGVAVLALNGAQYDAAPIQLMAEIQSPVDATGQRIIVAPLSGDFTNGLANLGNAFPSLNNAAAQVGPGLASNEVEKTVSFTSLLSGGCLKSATISTTFPRVPNGVGSLVPTGKMGLLSFRVGAGVGLLLTPRTSKNRWSGIRPLHKTAMGNAAIAIPVFAPVC